MTDEGKRALRDRLYVLLLGTVITLLSWAWQFETPPPDLMETLAVSAGLRPVAAPFSLMWHYIASPLCRNFGLPAAPRSDSWRS